MTLIIIALAIWGASALIRMARDKRKQREAERRYAEQQKIAQMVREDRQRRAEETAARIALEAEQMRQRREQERLAREQEKQAKAQAAAWEKQKREDERRDAQIAKHEKRIADLECKIRKLDRDIEAQNELLNDYYGQLDWLLLQQSGTTSGSAEFAKWQNKIVSKNNQIRKAENKMADMKDVKDRANRELVA